MVNGGLVASILSSKDGLTGTSFDSVAPTIRIFQYSINLTV